MNSKPCSILKSFSQYVLPYLFSLAVTFISVYQGFLERGISNQISKDLNDRFQEILVRLCCLLIVIIQSLLRFCCRKGDPFLCLKLGSCLTLRNELSKGTHVLTKQEMLLGKGIWVESRRVREPRRTALPHGCLGFYGDGISFWVVFSQSFWFRVLPGGSRLVQPRWMPERRILGGGRTGGVSFWPFPSSSGWWRLISSLFLTRTSCHKTAHANGYYGAWPGWAVSVSVLPLTVQ